jgi:hypothetical protein
MPSKKCSENKIMRSEYTRSSGKSVRAVCVKNKGAPGKTPTSKKVLPKLKHGLLTEYGYHLNEKSTKRQSAIRKAMRVEGNLPVYRRLVVLKTYRKNEPGLTYNRISSDVKYAEELFEKNKLNCGAPKRKAVKHKTLKIKPILKKRKSVVRKRKKVVRFRT